MLKQKIKTQKFGNEYQNEHFFILNKGHNSGKPISEYCTNCFVFLADSKEEKEFFYFLFYGLWQGNLFRPFITGSVIPFIRIDVLINVVKEAYKKVSIKPIDYFDSIQLMKELDKHNEVLVKQITLIKQTKKALMYKMLK